LGPDRGRSSLIMSNGTNTISFLDPETFQVQRTIEVYDHGKPSLISTS